MTNIYILIEQAIGYALFRAKKCKTTEDLIELLSNQDFEKIKSKMEVLEFQTFTSIDNATKNCIAIADGTATKDLMKLLKKNLSESSGILLVADKKLVENLISKKNLNDDVKILCDSAVNVKLRTIRHNFHEFIGYNREQLKNSALGLAISFSRSKLKFNESRSDNMIIQTISLLDHADKVINKIASRLREWFGYHYPELYKIVGDNKQYAKIVILIKSRAGAVEEIKDQLEIAVQDSSKAVQIIEVAKTSMGYELTSEDFATISALAEDVLSMFELKQSTTEYLNKKMMQVCPNFSTLVGDVVAARLIAHSGSLMNLAKCPASTIQILGAEKALFRAMKTRGNTPKYGLLFHSSFVGRANKPDKGRISRFLAAKISLAVSLDCFSEDPVNIFGKHLKKQVEDQLNYLENGDEPKRTAEVMGDAADEADEYYLQKQLLNGTDCGKKKKKRKSKQDISLDILTTKKLKSDDGVSNKVDMTNTQGAEKNTEILVNSGEKLKKKKNKKKKNVQVQEITGKVDDKVAANISPNEQTNTKKSNETEGEMVMNTSQTLKSKKKNSKQINDNGAMANEEIVMDTSSNSKKTKKKKSINLTEEVPQTSQAEKSANVVEPIKKKKKKNKK